MVLLRDATHVQMRDRDEVGVNLIFRFSNGYGGSVVRVQSCDKCNPGMFLNLDGARTQGAEKGLWELAVLRFTGTGIYDNVIDYTTPITSGVLGGLTDEEVNSLLDRIEALPKRGA